MNRHRLLLMAVLAIGFGAESPAAILYQQVFNPPPPDTTPNIGPWSLNAIGGFNGTYSGAFDPNGLRDAATDQPIGRTGPADTAGTAVYTGIGGPVTNDLRMFYTVNGQADFNAFDPATCPGCTFNIYANTQGGGLDDVGYFAVFAGPGGRDPSAWYVSTTPMAIPTQNASALFDLRSLAYNPAAGNWNNLTVDPTNTVAPVVGGPAGSLAGLLITGVGVLHSVTNPDGDFSSWNYAHYFITCIPEPTALVLVAIGATAIVAVRRRDE